MWVKYCDSKDNAVENINCTLTKEGHGPFKYDCVDWEEAIAICTYAKPKNGGRRVTIFYLCQTSQEKFLRREDFYFDRSKEWSLSYGTPIEKRYLVEGIPWNTVFFVIGEFLISRRFVSKNRLWKILLKK